MAEFEAGLCVVSSRETFRMLRVGAGEDGRDQKAGVSRGPHRPWRPSSASSLTPYAAILGLFFTGAPPLPSVTRCYKLRRQHKRKRSKQKRSTSHLDLFLRRKGKPPSHSFSYFQPAFFVHPPPQRCCSTLGKSQFPRLPTPLQSSSTTPALPSAGFFKLASITHTRTTPPSR